ncbi:MAG: dihydrodipicolinate synthase family protein, partial [Pseudomonadota bacterium]|nr:dihydrodipicolinate synthase family protein [Pseudomonadota bacterium]
HILYNVPGRTSCDLKPATVERLAKIANIVGLKEATGDLQRAQEILDGCGDAIDLYGGDDATCRELILMGGKGVISVTANVAPKAMHEMCAAALADDQAKAEALDAPLAGLHEHLFVEANPIPVKWALAEMGLIGLGIRLPLTVFSAQYHEILRQAMRQAGVL